MKKILLMAIAIMVAIASCSKPEPDNSGTGTGTGNEENPSDKQEQVEQATISLSATETTLGGTMLDVTEVSVSTNQKKITPVSNASWMTAAMMGKILTITASEHNETGAERTGTITVTAGEGDNTAVETVTVTQLVRDVATETHVIELTSQPADIAAEEGSKTSVTFTTNQSGVSVSFPAGAPDWLSYEVTDGTVTFTALSKNTSGAHRTAEAFLTAGTATTQTFTLRQLYAIDVPTGLAIGALYEGGMIFEVGADYVKVISITQTNCSWTSEPLQKTAVGTDPNAAEGKANTDLIASRDDFAGNFPAAEWCVGLGEGWYLPSSNELYAVCDGFQLKTEAGRERVQSIVKAHGGDEFALPDGYYHTSCEHADVANEESGNFGKTKCVRFRDRSQSQFLKSSNRNVRAVKKIMVDIAAEMDKINGGLGDFNITDETWTN